MLKKNWFVIVVLVLYLLFLAKDHLFGFLDNTQNLDSYLTDVKLLYYQNEYQEMKKLLDIDDQDYSFLYSKVLLRDIYYFYDEITISKGSSDGIKVQDLVVNEEGVLGIVKEVKNHSSGV